MSTILTAPSFFKSVSNFLVHFTSLTSRYTVLLIKGSLIEDLVFFGKSSFLFPFGLISVKTKLPIIPEILLKETKAQGFSYLSEVRTKIFKYCTCPAERVTYNFHSSCKHMHLPFKSVCNKEHKSVINM